MMVAAISTDKTPTSRLPLLPSDKDQQHHQQPQRPSNVPCKKPRGKLVPSRYLSPSPSSSTSTTTTTTTTTTTSTTSTTSSSSYTPFARRHPSPLLSRPANSGSSPSSSLSSSVGPKRSQSADGRRGGVGPTNVSGGGEASAATKMLITSTRSLSVSFQGEAFSLPISKAKVAATPGNAGGRKATPERKRPSTPGRDQGENFRPVDQHRRWPGRTREGNFSENSSFLSRSLNYGAVSNGARGSTGSVLVGVKSLDGNDSLLVDDDRRLSLDLGNAKQYPDANLSAESPLSVGDLTASDSDSVSSGSTSGTGREFSGTGRNAARGIAGSARFWQETNSRLRRLQDPGSPLTTSPASRMGVPSKGVSSKRFSSDGPLASPRSLASPVRGAMRPASPSKLWATTASSPSRALSSPSRVRPVTGNSGATPSILSFSVDLRRSKIGEERISDAHTLRLLYNHYLQWRFVNARADATFMLQSLVAEKNLWNAWVKISELRHTVTLKRVKLLLLRQKLKLSSILKGQMLYLEEWSLLDREHSNSLEGATEALKASTLRLPVVGKAISDIQNIKDAVSSAVDVMQAIGSSVCSLSDKVEETNALMAEIVNITANERALLEQCRDYLSIVAAMQVTYCSLRTHIIQVRHLPTTSCLTTPV